MQHELVQAAPVAEAYFGFRRVHVHIDTSGGSSRNST